MLGIRSNQSLGTCVKIVVFDTGGVKAILKICKMRKVVFYAHWIENNILEFLSDEISNIYIYIYI